MTTKLVQPGRRRIALGAAALALAAFSGVALAGGADVFVPRLGVSLPADKAAAVENSSAKGGHESTDRAPVPTGRPDAFPAAPIEDGVPIPISPALLDYRSGWMVGNGVTLVAVYAGAAADDATTGRFVIVRQNQAQGTQTQNVVDVPGAGALALVDTPHGDTVETSAQRADLRFSGARGRSGVLHLANDSVGR